MKIREPLRIYHTLSLEVNKPESEVLETLKNSTKGRARFSDGDKILKMNGLDGSIFFDRTQLGVSIEKTPAGKSMLRFDFYTRYPANLKTLAKIVTIVVCILFVAILSMGSLSAVKDKPAFFLELFIYFLKFMLAIPFLAVLAYLGEMSNRYTTKLFVKRIVRDL